MTPSVNIRLVEACCSVILHLAGRREREEIDISPARYQRSIAKQITVANFGQLEAKASLYNIETEQQQQEEEEYKTTTTSIHMFPIR